MYQDYANPWRQTEIERWSPDKAVVLNAVDRHCQEHGFTHRLQQVASEVLGVDIADTAIAKARQRHSACASFLKPHSLSINYSDSSNPRYPLDAAQR